MARPKKFASPAKMAANRVLQDYDLARPWKLVFGQEGLDAIRTAPATEKVEISRTDYSLKRAVAVDAKGNCYVFVLKETETGQ